MYLHLGLERWPDIEAETRRSLLINRFVHVLGLQTIHVCIIYGSYVPI